MEDLPFRSHVATVAQLYLLKAVPKHQYYNFVIDFDFVCFPSGIERCVIELYILARYKRRGPVLCDNLARSFAARHTW